MMLFLTYFRVGGLAAGPSIRRGAKPPSCECRCVGRRGGFETPLLLQSYCQATCGIFLQQLIPTKLPIKVPFKVRNVTLVTIAWGGTHRTVAECEFYLGKTTPEEVKCVFYHTPRARPGYAAD